VSDIYAQGSSSSYRNSKHQGAVGEAVCGATAGSCAGHAVDAAATMPWGPSLLRAMCKKATKFDGYSLSGHNSCSCESDPGVCSIAIKRCVQFEKKNRNVYNVSRVSKVPEYVTNSHQQMQAQCSCTVTDQ
jgi:hypothetical protein